MALPHVIPDAQFRPKLAQTSASDLNRQIPAEELQLTLAAEGTPIPVAFGKVRLGALIAAASRDTSGNLVLCAVWCEGEIEAVDAIYMDNDPLPGSVTATHYTGTAGQTVNAKLAATIAGFTDAMPNTAYSVFTIPAGVSNGFPRLVAEIRGLKVPMTDGGTPTYTDNPAYCIAALIESTSYGMGRTVDWTSVETVADAADATVGGTEKKRLLNIVLADSRPVLDWINVLRAYANCWVVPEGLSYRMIQDTTGVSVKSFTSANIVKGSLTIEVRGTRNVPTVLEVEYTDTTGTPWRTNTASIPDGGATPRRVSRIAMPGITRYSEARRFAIERLNAGTLNDMTVRFVAFDEALSLQVGDLIDVTHPVGLTAKVFRCMNIAPAGAGRWQILATEYDASVYSSEVVSDPSVLDTEWDDPNDPPTVTSLDASEQTYALDSGMFASRIVVTWTADVWPFLRDYRIDVRDGTTLVHTGTAAPGTTRYVTPALAEGVTYTVAAAIVSRTGVRSADVTDNVHLYGKDILPGDVPSITGYELGGRVFLQWEQADNPTDPGTPDPDVWRYELRRGPTDGTWATAEFIDTTDALTAVWEGAPAGDWRIYVKAIDSVRQYSTNAAYFDVTVTSDATAFLVDSYQQTSPTLTNMASYTLWRQINGKTYYVTEDDVAAGTKYSSNLSTYTNDLASYHSSLTSTWLGESEDFGSLLAGNWRGTATVEAVSGTYASYFGHSANGSAWTYETGLAWSGEDRYARLKHEALTTSTLLVTQPTQVVQIDAIPRTESGTDTSSASAATTITLANEYVAVKKIVITPKGGTTTPRFAVYDNIVIGSPTSFDVYIFDDTGTKQVTDFIWEFQGI